MKRRILLPTDFSVNALQAINYALELYKDEPCIFYLLNIFHINSENLESILKMEPERDIYETAKLKSASELDKLVNILALGDHRNSKHSFQTNTIFDTPLEAMKKMVEENDIELIVMGTRGETNALSKIYGSTALSVMEKIRNCPVIVVPKLAKLSIPKEIVFPTSFSKHFKRRELKYLVDIAKRCDASIKVLHIMEDDQLSDSQQTNKKQLEDFLDDVNHSFHFLRNMSILAAINCFVESRESDMVAVINKKQTFFASIMNQPLAKGIAYDSRVPLLIMHNLKN